MHRVRPGWIRDSITTAIYPGIAASVTLAAQAARQAPRGKLRRYPVGHFAAYLGARLEQMVTD
jgi:hypothetical protein